MSSTIQNRYPSRRSPLPGIAVAALLLTGCATVKPATGLTPSADGPPCVPPTAVAPTHVPVPTGNDAADAVAVAMAAAADAHAMHVALAAYHHCLAVRDAR